MSRPPIERPRAASPAGRGGRRRRDRPPRPRAHWPPSASLGATTSVAGRPGRAGWRVARSWLAWLSAARLPLGRVAGFPVYLSPSWLLLAAALTVGYVRVLGSDHQPLPVAVPY